MISITVTTTLEFVGVNKLPCTLMKCCQTYSNYFQQVMCSLILTALYLIRDLQEAMTIKAENQNLYNYLS